MRRIRGMNVLGLTIVSLCILQMLILPALAEELRLPELDSGKVALSWTELKTLLEELETLKRSQYEEDARTKALQELEAEPPVSYSIPDAQLHGVVETQAVRFEASFLVHILKKGWVTFPFLSNQIGIERVGIDPVDERSARFGTIKKFFGKAPEAQDAFQAQLVRSDEGYAVLAKGPGMFALHLTFQTPIRRENLTRSIELPLPNAVMNQISIRFPQQGVRLLETSSPGVEHSTEADGMTFETTLNNTAALQLAWTVEKDSGVRRKSLAELQSLASIEQTGIVVVSTLIVKHPPAVEELDLRLPLNAEILDVAGDALERWYAEPLENAQRLMLVGAEKRAEQLELHLTYRVRLPELPAQVIIPALEIHGVDALDGMLGVEVLDNLDVSSEEIVNGLLIPAGKLPQPLWQSATNPLLLGYEFHMPNFQAVLNMKPFRELETVVAGADFVDCVTHRTLEGKSITGVRYFIRNNDRQFLTLTLPPQSRIWQVFLDGTPVKPAQKEDGAILIPMKKSVSRADELQSFTIELGYITEVEKLSLKGELLNELPAIDLPSSYMRWTLYLPEDYEYTHFEGPLKQTAQFSGTKYSQKVTAPQIDIPVQGKPFYFEKHLIVDETPYIRGQYGQHLGNDIFLSVQPRDLSVLQKVTPNSRY